jgi:hypothetical protein
MWIFRNLQYLALLIDQIFSVNTEGKNQISECKNIVEMMPLLRKTLKFLGITLLVTWQRKEHFLSVSSNYYPLLYLSQFSPPAL